MKGRAVGRREAGGYDAGTAGVTTCGAAAPAAAAAVAAPPAADSAVLIDDATLDTWRTCKACSQTPMYACDCHKMRLLLAAPLPDQQRCRTHFSGFAQALTATKDLRMSSCDGTIRLTGADAGALAPAATARAAASAAVWSAAFPSWLDSSAATPSAAPGCGGSAVGRPKSPVHA